jgi:hypothetical protein
MKNLFFSLAFMLIGSFTFANNNPFATEIPTLSKFKLANLEVLNLDKGNVSNFLFKNNNCETGGFSFFSPFNQVEGLAFAKYNSSIDSEGNIIIEVNFSGKTTEIKLTNFKISEDGTQAFMDVKNNNIVFKSSFIGENLNLDFLKNQFANIKNSPLVSQLGCPPCAVVAVATIAGAVVKICTEASNACSPCNGNLTVGACSCSCVPK